MGKTTHSLSTIAQRARRWWKDWAQSPTRQKTSSGSLQTVDNFLPDIPFGHSLMGDSGVKASGAKVSSAFQMRLN
jgi:hypothetical protein